MDPKELIRYNLNLAHTVTTSLLADLDDDALLLRPVTGMNHIAWQVGHLISLERSMMEAVRPGVSPALPENFEANHSSATNGSEDRSLFLSKDDYLRLFDAQRQATLQILDEVSIEEMEKPSPESLQQLAPKLGTLFLLAGSHELMHSGQYSAVRRALGKPAAI